MSKREQYLNGYDSQLFDTLAKSSDRMFFFASNIKDNSARWSKAAVEYFGLGDEIVCPADDLWTSRIHPDDLPVYLKNFEQMYAHQSSYYNCEYRIKNAEGEYVWVNGRGYMNYDEQGEPDFFAGFVIDMGRRNKIDPVTSLWTVFKFRSELENQLAHGNRGAIILIGITNFKKINDEHGYSFGDITLHEIGKKLEELVGTTGKVYRMDGADFSIILPDGSAETVLEVKTRVKSAIRHLTVKGITLHIRLRFAATLYPEDGTAVDQLQNNVYYAMDHARQTKDSEVVFYTEELHLQKARTWRLKEALQESVANNCTGFRVVFQPIIDAATGQCISAEALLRWSNEEFPRIGPMDFIPYLEESREIITVGKWVIDESIRKLAQWREAQSTMRSVHINVSYIQFKEPSLRDYVVERLDQYGLDHDVLILELTESCRVEHSEFLREILQGFKDVGIRIAMDDFGTGYASLAVLKDIPTDIVKLDHTMTRAITERPKDRSMVEFVISYCKNVGIQVCAEGIEDEDTLRVVTQSGADLIQGYYYDKPLTLDDFYNKYILSH